jgi:SsrA-binding protein
MSDIAQNRKAFHDYEISDKYLAGIVLVGCEVKSIREGKVQLKDSFARVEKEELFLYNMHISPYAQAGIHNVNPTRTRKLLLKKQEIKRLIGKVQVKGLTLIPLRLFWQRNLVKIELGLAKSKKIYDKRAKLRKKASNREIERSLIQRH